MGENHLYFAGDEEVFSLDDAILDFGIETFADFMLICIAVGTVKVAITNVDRVLHRLGHNTRRRLSD